MADMADMADLFETCRRSGIAVELIADRAALAVTAPPDDAAVRIIDGPDATARVIDAGRRRIAERDPDGRRLLWLLGSTGSAGSDTEETDPTAEAEDDLAARLRAVDAAVGSIRAELESRCSSGRCLFVLTAARGRLPSVLASRPVPWAPLSESLAHVPLVLHDFGRTEPGRCPVLSTAADLAPTLREWFAIPAASLPSGEASLLTWTGNGRPIPREAVHWTREGHGWAVRTDEFLLIAPSPPETAAIEDEPDNPHGGDHDQPHQMPHEPPHGEHAELHLFVKPDDRWDLHDVAAQEPETVVRLREEAARWRSRRQ
jgi:hypothetical protein